MAFSFEPLKGRMNWTALVDWSYRLWQFAYTPALIGAPTTPTGTLGDASQQIANDAFVQQELARTGVTSNWITSFTPVVTASSGTITTATATMRYNIIGKAAFFSLNVTISNNGTGAGLVIASLPFTPVMTGSAVRQIVAGRDNTTGKMLQGLTVGASGLFIAFYDGAYPGSAGASLYLTGVIEIV